MNEKLELEEKFRESACIGDIDSLKILVESQNVNIDSQNPVNKWTALHWAAKRNQSAIVSYLLIHGADKSLTNKDGETPAQLTTNVEINNMLGGGDLSASVKRELPITPNYLANPPFPYTQPVAPRTNVVEQSLSQKTLTGSVQQDANELVLKFRIANSDERDFIEVELDRSNLTFESLLNLACRELCVERRLVHKIRKLPDTIVRKDKDVKRLIDFQAMELVLTNKAISSSSRNYASVGAISNQQILY